MARSTGERRDLSLANPVELRFEIRAYSPATMPMARLARYLENLANILGEASSVHLMGLEDGSTVPVLAVEWEAYPKVRKRAIDARNREGPEQAQRAMRTIERDLAADNAAYGDLVDAHGTRILRFAGTTRAGAPEYGPFSHQGTLDGVPIVVGGANDPVPVHLQTHDQIYHCLATRDLARRIGAHLFTTQLRVSGVGRWFRDRDGVWTMKSFRIQDYTELGSESLVTATNRLRAIDAAWKQSADPLGDLIALRASER